jgi:hypothetical protein
MKKLLACFGLLVALSACGNKAQCTFEADGIEMKGFSNAACDKMSLGYNTNK